MEKAYFGICLNRKTRSQKDERLQNPTGCYPQAEEKIVKKVTFKDTECKEVKEEMSVISDGNALEPLLNTISKLDAIGSQCSFHAKDKTKFYLQTIGQGLEHTNAAKKFKLE